MFYIPPFAYSPLRIKLDNGSYLATNAFVVPPAGGIVLYSPQPEEAGRLSVDQLRGPMAVTLAQLRELLGLPRFVPRMEGHLNLISEGTNKECEQGSDQTGTVSVTFVPSRKGVTRWEVDGWMRERTLHNLAAAQDRLVSLHKLVLNQAHMVVHPGVRTKFESALSALKAAAGALPIGGNQSSLTSAPPLVNYTFVHQQALEAMRRAEAAFFDKDMTSLLYFPPEHEAAIYIPHFLPVFWPIVTGIIWEIQHAVRKWMKRRRNRPKND